jgi:hypothetical protein
VGFSVLNPKERTTVERNIKQLLTDINDDFNAVIHNCDIQSSSSQIASSSSSSSTQNNQLRNKSIFSSFLESVSTDTTTARAAHTTSNSSPSVADELVLYKSLAMKEVQKIAAEESNPDPSGFW